MKNATLKKCPYCLTACTEFVEYEGEEMCLECQHHFYLKEMEYEEELWEMQKVMELEEWEAEQKRTQIKVEEEMW
jgi:hypothetical protein